MIKGRMCSVSKASNDFYFKKSHFLPIIVSPHNYHTTCMQSGS